MGQEARGYRFTGVLKTGGSVEGEVRAIRHKGVGYWSTAWTSAGETYQAQMSAFADAREGCKLLDLRKDWVEKAGPVPFRGETVNYTILDAEGIWYEASDSNRVKGEDPKADKLLRTKKLRNRPEAELLVLVLDASDKPLAHARKYIETQANLMPDVRGKNTFTEHGGQLEGNPIPLSSTVDGTAEFVLLKSVNSLDPAFSWLYAVSAIKVGDKTVAVCAKCKWSDRAAFDTTFVQIVKSLREK
jgi:hypothetical protein